MSDFLDRLSDDPCLDAQLEVVTDRNTPPELAEAFWDMHFDGEIVGGDIPVLHCLLRQCQRERLVERQDGDIVPFIDGENPTVCKKRQAT